MEAATSRTGLVYDVRMEEHKMELVSWHPEQPDRIRLPWEALEKGGYTKRCYVIQTSNSLGTLCYWLMQIRSSFARNTRYPVAL
eukprot:Em0017g593a